MVDKVGVQLCPVRLSSYTDFVGDLYAHLYAGHLQEVKHTASAILTKRHIKVASAVEQTHAVIQETSMPSGQGTHPCPSKPPD